MCIRDRLNREYLKDASERKLNGQSLTLTGRTGIRFYAKFLFIKYEKILTSYTYTKTWVYNNWDKIYDYWEKTTGGKLDESNAAQAISAYIQAHPAVNEVSNTAVLEDRDYLSRYERSWNSGGITPYSLDPENGAPQSLQTNAYPTANPELTEDGKLFVYLSDSGSTDVTKTVASWGLHNGFSYTCLLYTSLRGCWGGSRCRFNFRSRAVAVSYTHLVSILLPVEY